MFKMRILVLLTIIAVFPARSFSQEGLTKFFDNFAVGAAEKWQPHNTES